MDYNVEETLVQESAPADEALAPVQDEDAGPTLEEAFGIDAGDAGTASDEPNEDMAREEPTDTKGIKVRLKAFETKGYKRGREEAQRAWETERAGYEAQLQKLREYELKEDAAKLAKEEGISEGLAMRLLRAERGIAAPTERAAEPKGDGPARDAQGRFVAKDAAGNQNAQGNNENPRVQELYKEAQLLEAAIDGLSVGKLLENATDEEKANLMSGSLSMGDFVRTHMGGRKSPPVVRSANGGSPAGVSIATMPKDQFEKMNEALSKGQAFRI